MKDFTSALFCKEESKREVLNSRIRYIIKNTIKGDEMSKVTIKVNLDFEELKKVISELSEDEKESLFFELNPAWGKALQKMEKETMERIHKGEGVPWEKLRNEI